jgi:carboxyl-terminal processing protease
MSKSISPAKRLVTLLATLAVLCLVPARMRAEPVPGKEQDRLVTLMVCEFLRRGHLSQPEIGDEISRRLFRRFLKDLDPGKLYFLQSDIDEFKKQETQLDDMLLAGDLSFPFKVYERLMTRLNQRQKLVQEFVAAAHDFTAKEYIDTDYDTIPYAKNDDELRERWRKRIKFDLLLQRVGEKPVGVDEAKKKVQDRYQALLKSWKQMDNADLLEIYLTDLATSIDPHSSYMSANTLTDFEISMRLNLDGIGALLRSENGQTIIVEIVPGGAAAQDGRLKPNDKIIAVAQADDQFVDVVDWKLREVVKLIRGKRGTKVQLKIIPAGKLEPVVYQLTRQKIELKSQEARSDLIEEGKKANGQPYRIGIIDLPSFYGDASEHKSATEDVRRILKEFEAKHVDGVVLDLRYNGGGLLTEALALTGLFIDQGPIVQVKGSQGRVQRKNDPEKGTVYGGPLIVLTSRLSASASEILAGALQDYGRALIVGDSTTLGKGTVQTVIDLGGQVQQDPPPKLGALKLTIQQFYRVNGDSTQVHGVASDIVLPSLTEYLATVEKDQDHALPFDQVKPAEHDTLSLLPDALKAALRERSAKRIQESKEFVKLAKDVERVKTQKARKTMPLNEKELREQMTSDDAKKTEELLNGETSEETRTEKTPYKFKKNATNNEVLQIMQDLVQGKALTSAR